MSYLSFTYDGLSRLSMSSNPESGTISYSYDGNGNLVQKTVPAPNAAADSAATVTLGYSYDGLNRLCNKFYAAPPAASPNCPLTPPAGAVAAYTYDVSALSGAANTNGKLTAEATLNPAGAVVSTDSPYAYDVMGRMQAEQQCPVGSCYTLNYGYDYAGNVTSSNNGMTGTHALSLTYGYDTAAHLTSVATATAPSTPLFQTTLPDDYGPAGLVHARLGVSSPTVAALGITRGYDHRMRLVSETDVSSPVVTGTATGSSGSITVSGVENPPTPPTTATGNLQVIALGDYRQLCLSSSSTCIEISEMRDSLEITIGSFTTTASFPASGGSVAIAAGIASALSGTGSPVTAVTHGTAVVNITSIASGAVGNYPIHLEDEDIDLTCSAATNMALSGGVDAVPSDTGTITAMVNYVPATVTWGAGDNPGLIADRLATAIQTASGGTVTASSSGGAITLLSTATGASVNYPVSVSVADTVGVASPAFASSSANMSGGADSGITGAPVYSYNLAGDFSPVGDLLGYTDSVMGSWSFTYDDLDRLKTANGPSSQVMSYAYDSFGNRWPTNQSSTTSWSQFTANNQVPVGNGVSYDAAGNVTSLAGLHSFIYDDENRVASVDGTTSYLYDAEDNRVAKGSYSGSTFTPSEVYLLGPGNTQVTELDGSGNWKHSNVSAGSASVTYDAAGAHYQLSDWLGTRRVQTSGSGAIEETCSSLPFGDNLNCAGSGYDATEQHFTGKQHDFESGLDYFGARYLATSTGRWMSPDWSAQAEPVPYSSLDNPQSLNLYAYVGNNPLGKTDPDGHIDNPLFLDINRMANEEFTYFHQSRKQPKAQQNRQPDGSYKATPAQLADLRAKAANKDHVTSSTDPLGQCVTACERFTGVPGPTSSWRKGGAATDLTDNDIGTAIATFVGDGDKARYTADANGHKNSATFMGRGVGGIWVADQWPGQTPVRIWFMAAHDPNNPNNSSMNASSYSVIRVPNP